MVRLEDPNTWTTEYVISHRGECLDDLREINQLVIRYVRQENYAAGIAGLDGILNGLVTMQNSKQDNYSSFISMFSMVEAIVMLSFSPASSDTAIMLLEDARDFATKAETRRNVEAMIREIKAGHDVGSQDLREAMRILDQMDDKLASAMKDLKPQYDPRTDLSYKPSSSRVSSGSPARAFSSDPDFQEWIDQNQLTEDDLQYMKESIQRRMLFWFCLSIFYFGFPFFMVEWSFYKRIKQRRMKQRHGFFWTILCAWLLPVVLSPLGVILGMAAGIGTGGIIAFGLLTILLVFTLLASKKGVGTAITSTFKKNFVGLGELSLAFREEWERICRPGRIIRRSVVAVLAAAVLVILIIGQAQEPRLPANAGMVAIGFVIFFTLLDLIGFVICSVINNIRYRSVHEAYIFGEENDGTGEPDTVVQGQTPQYSAPAPSEAAKKRTGLIILLIVLVFLLIAEVTVGILVYKGVIDLESVFPSSQRDDGRDRDRDGDDDLKERAAYALLTSDILVLVDDPAMLWPDSEARPFEDAPKRISAHTDSSVVIYTVEDGGSRTLSDLAADCFNGLQYRDSELEPYLSDCIVIVLDAERHGAYMAGFGDMQKTYDISGVSSRIASNIENGSYEAAVIEMLENAVPLTEEGSAPAYLLPDSGTVYLTDADLDALTWEECCLARNEIYARHGRIFATRQIRDYFESRSWYNGTINGAAFDANAGTYLNEIERANISFIAQYEQQRWGGSYY